jgi:hypothetical protein
MSGKTGQRQTGRKPSEVRRKSAKTDGAFGKEQGEQVVSGDQARNRDKATKK